MAESVDLPPRMDYIDEEDLALIVEKLRVKARADAAVRISPEGLDAKRRDILVRAINNVVSTENAIFTYAQIIDGLPTADVGWDRRSSGLWGDHPLDEHEQLCPGAMEKAREVCPQWDISILAFDPQVLGAYRQATPGTKFFNTRLMELVAVAIHELGALLYQLEFRMHKGDIEAITQWVMPRSSWLKPDEEWVPIPPRPSIFNHHAYLDADIYPDGAADVVGYWAEDRIFGGVVVFDRRAETDQDLKFLDQDPPNVYLHPCRAKCTYRVTQLLDRQQQALVDFLLSEPKPSPSPSSSSPPEGATTPCPLPILVDDRNRKRVDAEVSLTYRGIFRDIWERKPLTGEQLRLFHRRPQGDLDYPEAQLMTLAINRAAGVPIKGRFKRYLDGEEMIEDGPWKRTLDEYKERFGWEKKIKLDDAAEGENKTEGATEGEKEGRAEEGKEGKRKGKQRENKREKEEAEKGKEKEVGEEKCQEENVVEVDKEVEEEDNEAKKSDV